MQWRMKLPKAGWAGSNVLGAQSVSSGLNRVNWSASLLYLSDIGLFKVNLEFRIQPASNIDQK